MKSSAKKLLALLLFTCLFLVALCGCKDGSNLVLPISEQDYSQLSEQNVSFTEPYGFARFNTAEGVTAEYGGNSYAFPAGMSVEARNFCISKVNALLSYFEPYGGKTTGMQVVLTDSTYPARVDGDTLYIGQEELEGVSFAVGVAQLSFGKDVNYGLLYALADRAMDKLYACRETLPDAAEALTAIDPELFDLTYACFIQPYVTEEELSNVKAVACALLADLTDEELVNLLKNYTPSAFYERLNEFLTKNGMEERDFSFIQNIAFSGGGQAIRLVVEDAWCTYYVQYDFQDLYAGYAGYGITGINDPFNEDYAALVDTLRAFNAQISYVRQVFKDYELPERVTVLLHDFSRMDDRMGQYDMRSKSIDIRTVTALQHEYVHAILDQPSGWNNEMLAFFYGSMPTHLSDDPETNARWNYGVKPSVIAIRAVWNELADDSVDRLIIAELKEHMGDMIDPCSREANIRCSHIISREVGIRAGAILKQGNNNPNIMPSFYAYLSEAYGEANALRATATNKPKSVLGATWDEIIAAWIEWLGEPVYN